MVGFAVILLSINKQSVIFFKKPHRGEMSVGEVINHQPIKSSMGAAYCIFKLRFQGESLPGICAQAYRTRR